VCTVTTNGTRSERAAASAAHDAPNTECAWSSSTCTERSLAGSRGPKSASRCPAGAPGTCTSGSATSTSPRGPTTVTLTPALAQRVALPPNGDRDATDIRERDIGQEGDVHERSLRV